MAFSLRAFIKSGFMQAIGNKPNYEIKLAAAGWLDKGVLLEEDLAEIEAQINKSNEEEQGVVENEIG